MKITNNLNIGEIQSPPAREFAPFYLTLCITKLNLINIKNTIAASYLFRKFINICIANMIAISKVHIIKNIFYLKFTWLVFKVMRWRLAVSQQDQLFPKSPMLECNLFSVWSMKALWCNGYCHWKWIQKPEFKTWTRLYTFSLCTNTLGKGVNTIILPQSLDK